MNGKYNIKKHTREDRFHRGRQSGKDAETSFINAFRQLGYKTLYYGGNSRLLSGICLQEMDTGN